MISNTEVWMDGWKDRPQSLNLIKPEFLLLTSNNDEDNHM